MITFPEPSIAVLPVQNKNGHGGVLLMVLNTLACPRRMFLHGVSALLLEQSRRHASVWCSGGHLRLLIWPSLWGDRRAQMGPCEQGHGGHKQLPGVFPWLGHLSLV